jgi:HK97 family phage major capsid protein/HK97 family phage prohead protease
VQLPQPIGVVNRAYSLLHVKAVDVERRVITGTASTPEVDRVGDVVEPKGMTFNNPLPLLLYHDSTKPVGRVTFAQPTSKGVQFEAHLPVIDEPGTLRDRVDEAWQSLKHKLIAGVSIGFRPVNDAIELMKNGGLRFLETEVLELSLVVIPANASAVIHTVKSLDLGLAASGIQADVALPSAGVSASTRVVKAMPQKATQMKTTAEQISTFEATRQAKSARMAELMNAAGEKGETLDEAASQEYDGLEMEVKSVDAHLKRLRDLEAVNKAAAVAVSGHSQHQASVSRDGNPVIQVRERLEPGIGFARAAKCLFVSRLEYRPPLEIAKEMYPGDDRLVQHFTKTAVSAGTTTGATWAGPLVDPANLASEFVEFLRPQTILGKFGTNGIPSLRRIPFNVRITGQTSGGDGYWVGQGAPKPLTKFDFNATTHTFAKVAAIAVIAQELARFSSPSADALVRQGLADAIRARLDTDFVDPDKGAVANVSPASITNNIAPLTTSGSSEADVRADVARIFAPFIAANLTPTNGVWIMSTTRALSLSLMMNALGQPVYPSITMNGGTFMGMPVIVSEYVVTGSPASDLVILVNASDIYLSDDGQVTVDASTEASLQMDDAPTNNSATPTATSLVSMFQTNSIALRAERYINWSRRRAQAVQYLENVNWGAGGGSPS